MSRIPALNKHWLIEVQFGLSSREETLSVDSVSPGRRCQNLKPGKNQILIVMKCLDSLARSAGRVSPNFVMARSMAPKKVEALRKKAYLKGDNYSRQEVEAVIRKYANCDHLS